MYTFIVQCNIIILIFYWFFFFYYFFPVTGVSRTRLERIRGRHEERRLRVVGVDGRVLEPVVEIDRILTVALQTAENMAGMARVSAFDCSHPCGTKEWTAFF